MDHHQLAASLLSNPSFEAEGETPASWSKTEGARTPGLGESLVAVDRSVAKDGRASLRLSGDATTGSWRIVVTVPPPRGDAAVRSAGYRRQRGRRILQ